MRSSDGNGAFIGQSPAFFTFMSQLAEAVDEARHGG